MGTKPNAGTVLEPRKRPTTWVFIFLAVGLVAAGVFGLLSTRYDHWDTWSFVVIATMTVVSDLTAVDYDTARLRISGSFLGIVLAAVLLGGGPAALIGVTTISVGWFKSREAPHHLVNNLLTFAWFPLVSGSAFHVAVRLLHVDPNAASYYLLVFVE